MGDFNSQVGKQQPNELKTVEPMDTGRRMLEEEDYQILLGKQPKDLKLILKKNQKAVIFKNKGTNKQLKEIKYWTK